MENIQNLPDDDMPLGPSGDREAQPPAEPPVEEPPPRPRRISDDDATPASPRDPADRGTG